MAVRCVVLVWAPRCVCLPIPPPFPWGREPVAALLGALGVFSSRGILGVRRTGLRCIVLVRAPRGVYLPFPPPFPWGREPVAALRCGPRWVLLLGVASGLFVAVRQWSVVSSFPPVGGRAPCRSVRLFPAFRPRTPCFCNPLMVSQERYDCVLSSVLKTDASTAAFAKLQGVKALWNRHVRTVHFCSLAGA